MFVDEARVFVASGKGGDGAVSFHREKYRPKGGPDGGNGGRGGSVILMAQEGLGSLSSLKDHPHQRAKGGGQGARNNQTGADADDLVVPVPLGTLVKEADGTTLADLVAPGDRYEVAKGGRGGRGNASFVASNRRIPGFSELGEPGEEYWIQLELRLIADVAVIGYPNAGKSTLVGALSAAHPKVAAYPFTTLEPSLGVVSVDEDRFTVCDIPGLIEGASQGKGLGLKFLRHADRAHVFVHLIDVAAGRDPLEDYQTVRTELVKYRTDLAMRPEVVVINKIDVADEETIEDTIKRFSDDGIAAIAISAQAGIGMEALKQHLWMTVKDARDAAGKAKGFELFRTADDPIKVHKQGSVWHVESKKVRRWVAMTDMSNSEAVAYLQNRLERGGVERALADAGASPGDEVTMGGTVFEWWPIGTMPEGESGGRRRGRA